MREGYSKVRNEALAMAFSYMHLIERWGTGMLRVAKMIKDAGLEKLEILGGETELRFNIYRNLDAGQTQEIAKQPGQTVGQTQEITKELGQTVGQNGEIGEKPGQTAGQIKVVEEKRLLDILLNDPRVSVREVAQ